MTIAGGMMSAWRLHRGRRQLAQPQPRVAQELAQVTGDMVRLRRKCQCQPLLTMLLIERQLMAMMLLWCDGQELQQRLQLLSRDGQV